MIAFEKTARVSSKGQITLPKAVRDFLHTDVLRVVIEDGEVRIRPERNVAGSLKRYAKKRLPWISRDTTGRPPGLSRHGRRACPGHAGGAAPFPGIIHQPCGCNGACHGPAARLAGRKLRQKAEQIDHRRIFIFLKPPVHFGFLTLSVSPHEKSGLMGYGLP